jgi:hypothetical protein
MPIISPNGYVVLLFIVAAVLLIIGSYEPYSKRKGS